MNRIQAVCNLLITYLKLYGVSHIVISSGTRAIPFIKAIENDSYFKCFSVIDERNAAFFALGLAQQLHKPVGLTCTSGTAVSNYLSGMTEAFYSNTPLVAITADRSMQVLNQLETQKVDQPAIFTSVVKKSVCLPVIKDEDDFWYGKHLLDEAFIGMSQHGIGPIHVNLPIEGSTNQITLRTREDEKIIINPVKLFQSSKFQAWESAISEINKYNKIAIIIGQNINLDQETSKAISRFCKDRKIPIIGDNLSNFRCEEMVFAQAPFKAMTAQSFEAMLPELVISIGNNFQERIKDLLKVHKGKYQHWLVDEGGAIKDWSKSLTAVFESSIFEFFYKFNTANVIVATDGAYLRNWKAIEQVAKLPDEMPWSNFYLARQFASMIPENSLLHLAILNSTRLMQFFKLPPNVKVTCNASSFGIDGCLPTLIGQSAASPEKLAFILLGDLSFIYAMNAIAIKGISSNVRVLVSNNGGGAEFHIFPHLQKDEKIDLHIAAAHSFKMKEWTEAVGFEYLKASNKEELNYSLKEFVKGNSIKPKLLEVFTDLHFDGEYCLEVYRYLEKEITSTLETIKSNRQ